MDVFKTEVGNQILEVEIGKMAQLANGSCFVKLGDTSVLATVTMSDSVREGIDFFPLVVDFEEKLYSVGRIPGSFSRREGKPSEKAILISRLIDRSIRPLFPKDFRNDVSVVCTALSYSEESPIEIASLIGASIALSISDVPWNGPIASSLIGILDGSIAVNPSESDMDRSDLHLTVSSTLNKILMIEAGANQISDDKMFESVMVAHEQNKKIIEFIKSISSKVGLKKCEYSVPDERPEIKQDIEKSFTSDLESALYVSNKKERELKLNSIANEILNSMLEKYPDHESYIKSYIYEIEKSIVRRWLFDNDKRVDGRGMDQIRDLKAEVGLIPKVHGSALFSRGLTQVLSIATLAPLSDCQLIDGVGKIHNKYYMHHYNFPPYSVGESRPLRAPGRREIGHGALAERALRPVIPPTSEFPYSIRVVSEILSSNGSTSQGSVCGSTLALMDAGVPIAAPVAGISCGLITKGDSWKTFVDIQGIEDFFGDMDFKVAGTKTGITAIQVDVKIDGLLPEIVKEAFSVTHKARIKILDECMLKALSAPRSSVSENAPKILSYNIPVDKIRDVIGAGGKTVQKICADFDVSVDIEDDGRLFVSSKNIKNCEIALNQIKSIVKDVQIGDVVSGKITRIASFGVFAEIAPGKEGMCHISNLSDRRIERVTDVVSVGDIISFKVIDIDSRGRIDLRRISAISSFKD